MGFPNDLPRQPPQDAEFFGEFPEIRFDDTSVVRNHAVSRASTRTPSIPEMTVKSLATSTRSSWR